MTSTALAPEQIGQQIFSARSYAWRWEQQPAYEVDCEAGMVAAFLAGHPQPPDDDPEMVRFYDQVRALVRGGAEIGRVRVVDDPPTDYQRWLRWADAWNTDAGERILYLPRPVLARQHREVPVAPEADWWLIDGVKLIVFHYRADRLGRLDRVELVTDPDEVRYARLWMTTVIGWATDELTAHPVAA
jgi:hypothetical protein